MRLNRPKSSSSVVKTTEDKIFIVDNFTFENPTMSVTNDADRVTEFYYDLYPGKRIIYRDTEGRWDELMHVNGQFAGYAPYHEKDYPDDDAS